MKNRIILVVLTLVLLISCAVFSVSAAAPANTAPEAFNKATDGCPCDTCKGSVYKGPWVELSSVTTYTGVAANTHYVVSEDMYLGTVLEGQTYPYYNINANNIVIVVEAPIFAKDGFQAFRFGMSSTSKVWLLGASGAEITGTGTTSNGALMRIGSKGNVTIDGDLTIELSDKIAGTSSTRGLIDVLGSMTMLDGTINGMTSTAASTVAQNGGALYVWGAGNFSMSGGVINGGTVPGYGGAIYTTNYSGSNPSIAISGDAYICDGHAKEGGNIYLRDCTMTLGGTATITGGVASVQGGNISQWYGDVASTLTITGGTISDGICNGTNTTPTAFNKYLVDIKYGGGNVYVSRACTLTISGGEIKNGSASNCAGGNVFVRGTLNVSGSAKVTGGTAIKGGNIYAYDETSYSDSDKDGVLSDTEKKTLPKLYAWVNISGGEVTGGAAVGTADVTAMGGTIYAYGGGKNNTNTTGLKITGGKVGGGTAGGDKGGSGGAIYVNDTNVTLSSCTINGGTATEKVVPVNGKNTTYGGQGGAIYHGSGTVNMEANTTISGGTAWRGGCVYVTGTFNMKGGTMSGGKSTNQGGQGFVTGTFNMSGGTVTANTASTSNARGFRIQNGKMNMSGDAKVISANKAIGDGIDLLRTSNNTGDMGTKGVLTLAGNASVVGPSGEMENNIRVQNYSKYSALLSVAQGWAGQASVWYEYLFGTTYKSEDYEYAVGMTIPSAYGASTGDYTGTLLMETAANNPPLYAGDNNTLQVASVQLCTYNLPKLDAQWFKSGTEAAAAAKPGDYIGIYAAGTMDIGNKDVLVDFNGYDCTVTGTGKLTIMDAAGDDYGDGLAKITYNNVAATALNPYNDRQYIALANGDGTYSAHRVDLHISAVSVRPSSAGVYYTATLNCDETLRTAFQAAGIAVSMNAIPGHYNEAGCLYTRTESLPNGGFTGVLVNNILKSGEDNDDRGKDTMYANAYAEFTVAGQTVTIMADPYNAGNTKESGFEPGHRYTAYSLYDVMHAIDLRWRTLEEKDWNNVLDKLYNSYNNVMHSWGLQYMIGQVKNLKVLTIGNSLSVDAGNLLGYVAKLEGMENIHFSTLYYGGCTLAQHASFLENNSAVYRFYNTDVKDLQSAAAADIVPKVISKGDNYTMYQGITADAWDIIILQQGVFDSGKPETYNEDMQTLIDYVRKHCKNPNFVFGWNSIWAPPVEEEQIKKASNGTPPDASNFKSNYMDMFGVTKLSTAVQDQMFEAIIGAVQQKIRTNPNFSFWIPSGTAQWNALSAIPENQLYRDYIHAGEIARVIYSYMWYSRLTDTDYSDLNLADMTEAVPLTKEQRIQGGDQAEVPAPKEAFDYTEQLDIVKWSVEKALANPYERTPYSAQ